jgi:sigma-B regulation protein RsbU (phosphoserine phosphatase)
VRRLETGGTILGAFQHATFDEETVQLVPDDVLVAFSDGVTEALSRDGEEFGEERLLACVEERRTLAPESLLESILDTVRRFSAGAVQSDDLTILVLRYTGEKTLTDLTRASFNV